MSRITRVSPSHLVGPAECGHQPHFYRTENARLNYPFGAFLQEDTLQPCNKPISFDYRDVPKDIKINPKSEKEFSDIVSSETFKAFSAGAHETYLDMRVHSLVGRGGWVGASLFFGGMYSLIMWWMQSDVFYDAAFAYVQNWCVFAVFCLIIFYDLFRKIPMPVRFHQKNQEVYVWHKKVLYRIPWGECEISAIVDKVHMGYGHLKDGYELTLWLNPKHAINADLTGEKHRRLPLTNRMSKHFNIYCYWEYIRRYMGKDPSLWYEINKVSRRPRLRNKISIETFIYLVPALLIIILFYPARFSLMVNLWRDKWPKEVHEWTGEECNWH